MGFVPVKGSTRPSLYMSGAGIRLITVSFRMDGIVHNNPFHPDFHKKL
jgi:hypothetical protein